MNIFAINSQQTYGNPDKRFSRHVRSRGDLLVPSPVESSHSSIDLVKKTMPSSLALQILTGDKTFHSIDRDLA